MGFTSTNTNLASVAVFVSASLWGLYWLPLRYLESQGMDGGWAVALLNVPAALILLGIVAWRWAEYRAQLKQALLIGFFTGMGLALYATGLVYSSVVRVTLFFYLTPVWATLIGIYWLGETANAQRWIAIVGGLAGLGLLVSGGESADFNIGDVYALLSGVFWALGAAMINRYSSVPLAGMTLFQFIFTAFGAIALGAIAGAQEMPGLQLLLDAVPLMTAVSWLVLLPSVLIVFWAQKLLFPGRVGLLMMSEVLVAVASASILIPEETMSALEWCGAVLIIGACLVEVLASPAGEETAATSA